MAPRGGRGGSRGGGGVAASCPNAFTKDSRGHSLAPNFAAYVVYFVVLLGVLVACLGARKKHPSAKKLLGPIYISSLLCVLLGYILIIIAVLLRECETTAFATYYQWGVAFSLFFRLGNFLLLVAFVYSVNDFLRTPLGRSPAPFKIGYAAVLGVLGALTCGTIGVSCYDWWASWVQFDNYDRGDYDSKVKTYHLEEAKLEVAYWTLYLVGVFAGGALALVTLGSIRSRGIAQSAMSKLTLFTILAFSSMVLWTVLALATAGMDLSSLTDPLFALEDHFNTYVGLAWALNAFQALSYIFVIFVAKTALPAADAAYAQTNNAGPKPEESAYNPALAQQQQPMGYTFHSGPPPAQQQQYYQQQPANNGGAVPAAFPQQAHNGYHAPHVQHHQQQLGGY